MPKARKKRARKKKILIVDDEKDMCELLSMNLSAKGYATEMAYDGKEALKAVNKNEPDLIILDVKMPRMNGFQVLKKLKSSPSYARIPIIMLTVKKEPPYLDKGLTLGAEFYLDKPFRFDNLMNFVGLILKG